MVLAERLEGTERNKRSLIYLTELGDPHFEKETIGRVGC